MLNLKKADRNESWCTLSIDKARVTAKEESLGFWLLKMEINIAIK
jgi:hypothetical protein